MSVVVYRAEEADDAGGAVGRSGAASARHSAGAAAADAGFSLAFARSFSYLYDFVASVRPYLSSCCCRLPRGLRRQRRQTGKMFGKVSALLSSVRKSSSFLPDEALNGNWEERERACACVLGGNNTAARASLLARGPRQGDLDSVFICFYHDYEMQSPSRETMTDFCASVLCRSPKTVSKIFWTWATRRTVTALAATAWARMEAAVNTSTSSA